MPTFEAKERETAPATAEAAAAEGPKPYRVPADICRYLDDYRFTVVLDTSHVHNGWGKERGELKATDLTRPGVWDLCENLSPWSEIDVTYGPNPVDAWAMRLRVITIPKRGLLKHERDRGLIARKHVVVAIVQSAKQATPVWGDEPPETSKPAKAA
jgi:hypothetical protein